MKFGRIRDDLDQFRDTSEMTADAVLSLFFDLCEDVREETGRSVDRLPVSSVDSLMKRLPWTGNTVRRIYQANADEVLSPDRQRILADVDAKVSEVVAGAEKADGELEKTRAQRAQLRNAEERLRNALKEQERIQAECGTLSETIRDLRARIVPELTKQKERLMAQRSELDRQNGSLQGEIRELGDLLEKGRVRAQSLADEKKKLSVQLSDREKELEKLTQDKEALDEKVSLADSGVKELEEKIGALKQYLENRDYSALKARQMSTLEALTKSKADYDKLAAEHAQTAKELQDAQALFEAKRRSAQTEEGALRTALNEIRAKAAAAQEEEALLRKQQEAELAELEQESENQKLVAEARRLAILQRKQQVDQEAKDLLNKETELEEALSQMSGERTAQRIEAAKRRIAVMQQVREELDAHYAQLLTSLGKRPEEVKETELFENTLDRTEADIMECGRLYKKLLRSLEGKTK